ncbi:MAG: hypothetical protein Q8Q85_00025 [Gemmatimonadales bacterium]|nr:hypothetical protein [Gemmatimonadales bacterium]
MTMLARGNKGGTVIPLERGKAAFSDWHWGLPATRMFEWPDPDYPDHLVECGRLVELRVRMPGQRRSTSIALAEKEAQQSHLCFDLDHPAQRLYICSSPAVRAESRARFWTGSDMATWDLGDLAAAVGGRQATDDYPPVKVRPIGILSKVLYATSKKGDGPSIYVHTMGEEGGLPPALAVDSRGRFWIAGGSYTCPSPGITQ